MEGVYEYLIQQKYVKIYIYMKDYMELLIKDFMELLRKDYMEILNNRDSEFQLDIFVFVK